MYTHKPTFSFWLVTDTKKQKTKNQANLRRCPCLWSCAKTLLKIIHGVLEIGLFLCKVFLVLFDRQHLNLHHFFHSKILKNIPTFPITRYLQAMLNCPLNMFQGTIFEKRLFQVVTKKTRVIILPTYLEVQDTWDTWIVTRVITSISGLKMSPNLGCKPTYNQLLSILNL